MKPRRHRRTSGTHPCTLVGMRRRPLRTWALLAAAVLVVALGVGGSARAGDVRLTLANTAGLGHQSATAAAPDAVMRTEADRVEIGFSRTVHAAVRILLLFGAPLTGLALLLLLTPPRRARTPGGPPALARVRRWLVLRAPPSPLLVSLTP